jgi:hypothetical protein
METLGMILQALGIACAAGGAIFIVDAAVMTAREWSQSSLDERD